MERELSKARAKVVALEKSNDQIKAQSSEVQRTFLSKENELMQEVLKLRQAIEDMKNDAEKLKFDDISNISFSFANDSRAEVMAPDRSGNNSVNVSKGAGSEEVIIKISKKDLEKTMELSKKYKDLEKTAERHFKRIKQYEKDEESNTHTR